MIPVDTIAGIGPHQSVYYQSDTGLPVDNADVGRRPINPRWAGLFATLLSSINSKITVCSVSERGSVTEPLISGISSPSS
ncbi:unnamed protein product [Phytophthora fragariaefolia]|uniref:Unnamed protein product n=1 Tax=Phytophthora fragariaefolia TaxID=1490495 RepID=A0A9W7D142_9STRA|nr:unnamed protein product [Phytophthora fragariaefolia]